MPVDTTEMDGNTYGDKLSATLGARDVPELLVAPNWEVDKIARFSDAVKALFEDLTDHLKGDAALAYPNLASFQTGAWEYSVWGGRLAAVPFPTDGPFAYCLFYRKDLVDAGGLQGADDVDELYSFGKAATDAEEGRVGVRLGLRDGADVLRRSRVDGRRLAARRPAAGSSSSTRRRSTRRRSSSPRSCSRTASSTRT